MDDLTDKQLAVLLFIRDHLADPGWPPTMREIADHFGWRSTNAAAGYLEALERKDYIRTGMGQSRAIALVDRAGQDGEGDNDEL